MQTVAADAKNSRNKQKKKANYNKLIKKILGKQNVLQYQKKQTVTADAINLRKTKNISNFK